MIENELRWIGPHELYRGHVVGMSMYEGDFTSFRAWIHEDGRGSYQTFGMDDVSPSHRILVHVGAKFTIESGLAQATSGQRLRVGSLLRFDRE